MSSPSSRAGATAADLVVTFARFPKRTQTRGSADTQSWLTLAAALQRHLIRREKDGAGWGPYIYSTDPPIRKAANVAEVTCLVLDIETGEPLDSFREALEEYEWVAYSTHSHRADDPRFRIVLPLAQSVPAELWGRWWEGAVDALAGGRVDTSCRDLARFFYLPCRLPLSENPDPAWAEHHEGRLLDPDEIPLPPPSSPRKIVQGGGKVYGAGDYRTLDVVGWFQAHGHYGAELGSGKHAVICPWSSEHSQPSKPEDSDTVVWEADDGWPGFHCMHAHCDGRGIRAVLELWRDADTFCARPFVPDPQTSSNGNHNGHSTAPIGRKAPTAATEPLYREDLDNGVRFARQHGQNVRYCWTSETWYVWTGKCWREDRDGQVQRLAKLTARSILREAAAAGSDQETRELTRWAMASRSRTRLDAMLAMARSEPGIGVQASDFDRHPHLLNTPSGTLDLNTLTLSPHRREDLLTKLTGAAYEPDASDAILHEVLNTATSGDDELRAFLGRAFGSAIRGGNPDDKVFVIHGPTRTAKGTVVNAVASALGDYAMNVAFETFLARKDVGRPRPDVARLAGARFVYCSENDRGTKLAEALLKTMSGGDPLTVRFLFSREFEFVPQFKPFLVCNHLPQASHDDDALWERLTRIPFEHQIPEGERKPAYREYLRDPHRGGAAVLAWLVRGYKEWRETGLGVPQIVRTATKTYREEQEPLREFYAECCHFGPTTQATPTQLYDAYKVWAGSNGQPVMTQTAFGIELGKKGLVRNKDGRGRRFWVGIGVLEDAESPPDPRLIDQ